MSNTATAEKPATAPASTKLDPAAKLDNFHASEFARASFDHVMDAGIDFEEVFKPGYWRYVFHKLQKNISTNSPDRSGSLIVVGTEDHAFCAHLYVRAVTAAGLIVQCVGPATDKSGKMCPVDLATGRAWAGPAAVSSDQFDVRWNVGKRGFDILRSSDQQVIIDGGNFPTRELALEWIKKTTKV